MVQAHRGYRQQEPGEHPPSILETLLATAIGRRRRRRSRRHGGSRALPHLLVLVLVLLGMAASASAQGWWRPGPGVSWQVQLSGKLDVSLNVDMYDIDLFDTKTSEIDELRSRSVIVICSFSAGTFEEGRPDADDFEPTWFGEERQGGASGERWLNITAEGLLPVMEARMDLAVNKSCDGIDPSNVQVYLEANTGFNTTASEQLAYNTWLAGQAHDRDLSVALRNDWPQREALEPAFDWALSEDCLIKGECGNYQSNFVAAGKAVVDVEYFQLDLAFCDDVTASGLDVIVKDLSLDSRRCSCQNPSTDINCGQLLTQSPTTDSSASISWIIGSAVGASVFFILAAAAVSLWRRNKSGRGGGGSDDDEEDVMTGL